MLPLWNFCQICRTAEALNSQAGATAYTHSVRINDIGRGGTAREETLKYAT